ncbi:hypothetical protein JEQ12_019954 [Ovis aries]|uniref:Uncharacterized protein n=1 Tax=Ovis aries TaxID=9940 RepID=A0A835ZQZ4_SHEEP|nr:hypothetical protein JEQ12_019954 [Ovis aries]
MDRGLVTFPHVGGFGSGRQDPDVTVQGRGAYVTTASPRCTRQGGDDHPCPSALWLGIRDVPYPDLVCHQLWTDTEVTGSSYVTPAFMEVTESVSSGEPATVRRKLPTGI